MVHRGPLPPSETSDNGMPTSPSASRMSDVSVAKSGNFAN